MGASAVDVPGCRFEMTNDSLFSSFERPVDSSLATMTRAMSWSYRKLTDKVEACFADCVFQPGGSYYTVIWDLGWLSRACCVPSVHEN